ncbi:hypothetical protein GCM10010381_14020 [Streptomyces xantholiticus]|nr:hypothetical protein GCM10010381_14020 [Streptomyces xantholiticus]
MRMAACEPAPNVPVVRHNDLDRAYVGQDGLAAFTVAGVAVVLAGRFVLS